MSKPLSGVPKTNPERAALALITPDEISHVDLTGAAVTIQPPSDARFVVFAATGDFAVEFDHAVVAAFPGATAAAPAQRPEINPAVRFIGDRLDEQANLPVPVDYTFSVIGDGTGVCSIAFYS